eukprot:UN2627
MPDISGLQSHRFPQVQLSRRGSFCLQVCEVFRTAVYCEAILQWNASLIIGSARAHSRTLLVHCGMTFVVHFTIGIMIDFALHKFMDRSAHDLMHGSNRFQRIHGFVRCICVLWLPKQELH